jgi:uncharacterized peroxidase-related enzyme
VQAHAEDLRSEIDDGGLVHAVAEDWRSADLPASTRAALAFAEKLTSSPTAMTRADVAGLRTAGFTDEEIHDITQITAYFNYINRVADALGVPPEPEMTPRPQEDGAR